MLTFDQKCVRLIRRVGMPVTSKQVRKGHVWDGHVLKFRLSTEPLHDLAHWQICGQDRRKLPEFGLGNSPDTAITVSSVRAVHYDVSYFEERCASILGLLWERTLSTDVFRKTWAKHGWSVDHLDLQQHPITIISTLMEGGYVDGKLRPTKKAGVVSLAEEVNFGK